MVERAPRVFLSHSADGPHHVERVLELAQWLRDQGVDVRLDPIEVSPEDLVVVVCTARHLPPHVGDKVVLVVFDDVDVDELHDVTVYRLPKQRDELCQRLGEQPKVRPAPQGPLGTLEDDTIDSLVATRSGQNAAVTTSTELSSEEPAEERRFPRRLAIVAATLGVGILLAGLLISGVLENEQTSGSGQCSLALIDQDGNRVEDVGGASLILATGSVIAVTIEGNTLSFECPKVAVNARVLLERSGGAQHEVPVTISPGTQQQLVTLPDSLKLGP